MKAHDDAAGAAAVPRPLLADELNSLEVARALADAHLARMQESCTLASAALTVLQLPAEPARAAGAGGILPLIARRVVIPLPPAALLSEEAAERGDVLAVFDAACSDAERASAAARKALRDADAHATALEASVAVEAARVTAAAAAAAAAGRAPDGAPAQDSAHAHAPS
jgi:hypothetical protein